MMKFKDLIRNYIFATNQKNVYSVKYHISANYNNLILAFKDKEKKIEPH